jgi:hypothetical protein
MLNRNNGTFEELLANKEKFTSKAFNEVKCAVWSFYSFLFTKSDANFHTLKHVVQKTFPAENPIIMFHQNHNKNHFNGIQIPCDSRNFIKSLFPTALTMLPNPSQKQ